MDMSSWFAYVKYKDNEKEKVPISKISDTNDKGQKISFQPKDVNDYIYGKLYSVRTSLHSKDGKESKYYAVIGKIAESLEALENVRPRWPNVQDINDDEPESTGVEEEKKNEPINHLIEQNINQVKIKKNKKHLASNEKFKQFITNNLLDEITEPAKVRKEYYTKKKKKTHNEDNDETKLLQEKIKQLEADLMKKDTALSFANNQQVERLENIFEKKITELEERLEKNLENKVINVVEHVLEDSVTRLDQKITNIENTLSMSYTNNTQKVLDWLKSYSE